MNCEQKRNASSVGFWRVCTVGVSILLQIALIVVLAYTLRQYAVYIYVGIQTIAIAQVILMVIQSDSADYTISWLLVILAMPVFGALLFLVWGKVATSGSRNKRIRASIARCRGSLRQNDAVMKEFALIHPDRRSFVRYLWGKGFPLYKDTKCKYFPLGELQFEAMLADMEKAEKFIFMEYFIIACGQIWDRISDILIRKAAQGVEVRLMFDDMGSIITAPKNLIRTLREKGINVVRFSPIHRFISRLTLNFRNHQKITVIDGHIGYTGGSNLADEYANQIQRRGHWKDVAVRLEGAAVWRCGTAKPARLQI